MTVMTLDTATPAEIYEVALAMRRDDFLEFSAVAWADTREALADQITDIYGGRADVLCARAKGIGPVAIGGALELRPKVATLLFFATPYFRQIALPLTRFIRNSLLPKLGAAGVHRVEAVSMCGNEAAHRWIETLGLKPETGPLLNYGKGGESFIQFSGDPRVRAAGD